jgi:hypothetical protein
MVRRTLKDCQVYFDSKFVPGMMSASNQWQKKEDVISLSGLHSKSLTAVMNEEWHEVKCKKQVAKGLHRYRALSHAERVKFLVTANVFTFQKTDAEILEDKKMEEEKSKQGNHDYSTFVFTFRIAF